MLAEAEEREAGEQEWGGVDAVEPPAPCGPSGWWPCGAPGEGLLPPLLPAVAGLGLPCSQERGGGGPQKCWS